MSEENQTENVKLYSLEEEELRNKPNIVIINQSIWYTNPLAIWSFVLMIVGVITSIIPLMGIIAFFVLPTSFILGCLSLIKKRKPKWPAILGIIGSTISTLINVIVLAL